LQPGVLSIATALLFLEERPAPLPDGVKADRIVVEKSAHRMSLFKDGQLLRTYRVALGRGGMVRKEREGDLLVPEGTYHIDEKREPNKFYRALHLNYPNEDDKNAKRTGSEIKIHGLPKWAIWFGSWHRALDWTAGCIAVTNSEMDEIWRAVPDGTQVVIKP
jgi:murein L,D-transpeptidase YafK